MINCRLFILFVCHYFVIVQPAITNPFENSTYIVDEGYNTTITCTAVGYPPPTIVWSRTSGGEVSVSDSVSVPTGNGNVTSVSVNLTLTNASREETGLYQCYANNSVGSNTRNTTVTVQCECMMFTVRLWNSYSILICIKQSI